MALRGLFRRHERAIAAAYLVGVAAFVGAFAFRPTRLPALGLIERAVRFWDDRWTRRLEAGQQLLASGPPQAAVDYLTRLDRAFPATDVRHARDQQRELLLRLLGQAEEAAGHRRRAMEAYQRLVAFDPNNYRNHFAYAQAAQRLLSGWAEAPEARDGFAAVLQILPSHLPSLRGYVDYYLDRGEFIPIVAAYRSYLDAHLVQRIELRVGDSVAVVPILVDGRLHDVDLPFAVPPGSGQVLELATAGFSVAVDRVELEAPARVGRVASISRVDLDRAPARLTALEPAEHGAFRATDSTAALGWPLPSLPDGVARVRLRLALFKPVDRPLWNGIEKSYLNLLDRSGLDSAVVRTVVLPDPAAADRVMGRLPWARGGVIWGEHERPF